MAMRRALALVLLAALVACSHCSHRAPQTGGSGGNGSASPPRADAAVTSSEQQPPLPPPAADAEAELLCAGLESGFDELAEPTKVYPLRVGDGTLLQGPLLTLPRPPLSEDGYAVAKAMASARGDDLYVSQGTKLTRFQPFAPSTGATPRATAETPDVPLSLFAAGDRCFVGLGGRVDLADFSGAQPAVTKVFQSERVNKPVDYFVEMPGGRLVAVDDRVFPKYAFVFDWRPGKAARHLFTTGLPAGANESYVSAAAAGDVLAITATFGVMRSTGNRLYRCRFQGEEADCSTLLESQPGHGYAPPTEEDRASPYMQLLAGNRLTYWSRVAAVDNQLFICAGSRGILHLPVDGDGSAMRMAGVGGDCLDLLTHRGRVIALVRHSVPEGAPIRTVARVDAIEGVTRPAVGTRCTLSATPPDAEGTCNARIVCGQDVVFGGASGSSVPCTRDRRGSLTIEDMEFTGTDGDPIYRFYGGPGQIQIRDLTPRGETNITLNSLGSLDDAQRELVILRWDSDARSLTEVRRHDMPGAMTRLAR